MLSRRVFAAVRPRLTGGRRASGSAGESKKSESLPFQEEQEFRVLTTIWPAKAEARRAARIVPSWKKNQSRPRCLKMATDQDWKSVWPSAKMFNPAVVPLPIHMGYVERPDRYAPPSKWANAELMKIPNFLHLTPPAIKAHCRVLKPFCTPWPKELPTDEECFKHFPLEYVFTDYVHAAPTIRDVRSRVVKLRFKMSALPLDYHAKDKLKRILNVKEERYDPKTDLVTIVADRCPLKMQNYDYINYLLTACFFEAWKTEPWEAEKKMTDWERFYFEKSPCFAGLTEYLKKTEERESLDPQDVVDRKEVKAYAEAVTNLFDKGETEETIEEYKNSVLKLMFASGETQDMSSAENQKDDPST